MALDPSSLVVAHLLKQGSHYHYDRSDVRKKTHRDRATELEQAKTMGFYQYNVFKLIPIDKIVPQRIWKEIKAEKVRANMDRGRPLKPINLAEQGSRYGIEDGIHRYNVSVERGFTHMPAYLTVTVDAPELYEQPDAEKPQLKPGAYVKLRKPIDGMTWAVVDEVLGARMWKGVKRQVYGLIGGNANEAEFIGDIMDDKFDVEKPPANIKKLLDAERF